VSGGRVNFQQNTHKNMTLEIDKEFQQLIPPLASDELAQLESNIIQDGCRDPLVTWQDTIIDGHNRYAICKARGLPFKVITMEFADRSHAKEWIIRNQFGRRNLPPYVRVSLALELESTIAARAKENQIRKPADSVLTTLSEQNSVNTRAEIAKVANVSEGTIAKVKTIKAKASEETKDKLAKGEISINKAYQETKEPPCLVVDESKSKPPEISIQERNGMAIFASAKLVMSKLNSTDKEFTQSLDAMIEYCQTRKQTRK
jgi:ParB-like chromosome segregation protein Spo0J